MSDILMRVELHNPAQAKETLARYTLPWVGEQLKVGRELVAEFRLLDDAISDAQRAYLHAVVLTEIALYEKVSGKRYAMAVWKEHFRKELLPDRRLTSINPFTGKKSRRRVRQSTEKLGVKGMADYIDKVIAIAAMELGVVVSEPMPAHLRPQRRAKMTETVDQDTGEVMTESAACQH